jgi:hypothetical protein
MEPLVSYMSGVWWERHVGPPDARGAFLLFFRVPMRGPR